MAMPLVAFLLFIRIVLATQGHLCFHMNFQIVYQIYVKNCIGLLTETSFNMWNAFGKWLHSPHKFYQPTCTGGVSGVFFNFSQCFKECMWGIFVKVHVEFRGQLWVLLLRPPTWCPVTESLLSLNLAKYSRFLASKTKEDSNSASPEEGLKPAAP